MYSFIRIMIFLIVWLLAVCIIKKTKLRNVRKIYFISAVICLVLSSVACYIPVENAFTSFETAEQVFDYTNWEESQLVLEGENSCMVVYESAPSTSSFSFVGKDEDGYKILPQHLSKMISRKSDENGVVLVYNVKDSNDYYIIATVGVHENVQVECESGELESSIMTISNTGIYYIYVSDLQESTHLIVDGKTISIPDGM